MLLADIGVLENIQALGVGRHQSVFDAVVDHFDEMASARRAAMQITFFGSAGGLLATRGARCVAAAGRQRFENRVEMLYHIILAADHLAITSLQTPDATASSDVNVMNAFRGKFLGSANVVDI